LKIFYIFLEAVGISRWHSSRWLHR